MSFFVCSLIRFSHYEHFFFFWASEFFIEVDYIGTIDGIIGHTIELCLQTPPTPSQ